MWKNVFSPWAKGQGPPKMPTPTKDNGTTGASLISPNGGSTPPPETPTAETGKTKVTASPQTLFPDKTGKTYDSDDSDNGDQQSHKTNGTGDPDGTDGPDVEDVTPPPAKKDDHDVEDVTPPPAKKYPDVDDVTPPPAKKYPDVEDVTPPPAKKHKGSFIVSSHATRPLIGVTPVLHQDGRPLPGQDLRAPCVRTSKNTEATPDDTDCPPDTLAYDVTLQLAKNKNSWWPVGVPVTTDTLTTERMQDEVSSAEAFFSDRRRLGSFQRKHGGIEKFQREDKSYDQELYFKYVCGKDQFIALPPPLAAKMWREGENEDDDRKAMQLRVNRFLKSDVFIKEDSWECWHQKIVELAKTYFFFGTAKLPRAIARDGRLNRSGKLAKWYGKFLQNTLALLVYRAAYGQSTLKTHESTLLIRGNEDLESQYVLYHFVYPTVIFFITNLAPAVSIDLRVIMNCDLYRHYENCKKRYRDHGFWSESQLMERVRCTDKTNVDLYLGSAKTAANIVKGLEYRQLRLMCVLYDKFAEYETHSTGYPTNTNFLVNATEEQKIAIGTDVPGATPTFEVCQPEYTKSWASIERQYDNNSRS